MTSFSFVSENVFTYRLTVLFFFFCLGFLATNEKIGQKTSSKDMSYSLSEMEQWSVKNWNMQIKHLLLEMEEKGGLKGCVNKSLCLKLYIGVF